MTSWNCMNSSYYVVYSIYSCRLRKEIPLTYQILKAETAKRSFPCLKKCTRGTAWKWSSPHALWSPPKCTKSKHCAGGSLKLTGLNPGMVDGLGSSPWFPVPASTLSSFPANQGLAISLRVPGHSHFWHTAQTWSIPGSPSLIKAKHMEEGETKRHLCFN